MQNPTARTEPNAEQAAKQSLAERRAMREALMRRISARDDTIPIPVLAKPFALACALMEAGKATLDGAVEFFFEYLSLTRDDQAAA